MSLAEATESWSDDALLGGKVRLRQPVVGYRAAVDPVLLAAAVPAIPGDSVLDIGCGVGAAAFCLAARVPGCRLTGLERQEALARLAADNAVQNGVAARVTVLAGDLLRPPPLLAPGSFAHVMANPPYLPAGAASPSPDPGRARAAIEGEADLAAWVRFALAMVRIKGGITFVHRADRLAALLAALDGPAGDIAVLPIWPGAGKPAKRVIVQARKGSGAPLRLLPGLVLHGPDGRYSEAAEAILRHGAALTLAG